MAGASKSGARRGTGKKKAAERATPCPAAARTEPSPLEYLLRVVGDEAATPAARLSAAKSAAPYVHARLASTELRTPGLDRIGEALLELMRRAQEQGGGVAGLVRRKGGSGA